MLNINLKNVKKNVSSSSTSKKAAYEKLKVFKEKNEKLKAAYVAKGLDKVKIVL
jgi:hypothetical protein